MTLIGKISQLCSDRIHDDTDSHFVFKFHRNRQPGSGWNDALLFWQKQTRKMRFSRRHFVLLEGAKSLQGSVPRDPTSPCNISSIVSGLRELFPKNSFRATVMPSGSVTYSQGGESGQSPSVGLDSDKNIVGSVVHAAELNWKWFGSFYEKRSVA